MSGSGAKLDEILAEYRAQVLRWNPQINLVSRQDTSARVDSLIEQCREGWDQLLASGTRNLVEATRLWYCDLGSGAGLPGFVWHHQMAAAGLPVETLLVEPREKRAWFLERLARSSAPDVLRVAAHRWGEIPAAVGAALGPSRPPSHLLISLKALRLPDSRILEGLAPFLQAAEKLPEGVSLLIVRFTPPGQQWNARVAAELDIPPEGRTRRVSSLIFQSEGGRVLPPATLRGAGLVLSSYSVEPS
jgi:hypothetical protein